MVARGPQSSYLHLSSLSSPFKNIYLLKIFFLAALVFVAAWGLSLVAESGGYSLVEVHGL